MLEYSKELAERIGEYLQNQGWHCEFNEDTGIYTFGLNLRNKMKTIRMYIGVRVGGFSVYGVSLVNADEENIGKVMEYFTRVNYGLKYGNFEIDLRDYEVRFKCAHFCGDELPSMDEVETSIDMPYFMWSQYGDGYLSMLFSDESPEEAVEKAETTQDEETPQDEDAEQGEETASTEK